MTKSSIVLLSVIICLFSSISYRVNSQYLDTNPSGVEIYKIDLNRDPQERFKEVVIKYQEKTIAAINFYTNFVPRPIWWFIEKIFDLVYIPNLPEYYQEVEGMAKYMNINTNLLLVIQFVYDLSSFCTSIVVAEPGTGNVIHARNLDFLNPAIMRNITYEGWFYRDGKLLYRATMFAGMNGVMTGERPHAFSISLNSRNPSYRHNLLILAQNIAAYLWNAPQVTRVIRQTLEECDSYEHCAYPKLTTTPMMAFCYLTIAGSKPFQGAIISRDRYEAANIRYLSEEHDIWFEAQTNDDHFTGICTQRCQYIRNSISTLGRANVSASNLVNIMKQYPSNNMYSIYNTVMMPSQGVNSTIFETSLIANDGDATI